MTAVDWVLGALFRPSATYTYARNHLRFGYWWILLSVFTLEIVMAVYHPQNIEADGSSVALINMALLMVTFDLYGVMLWGAARAFQWELPWVEAVKIVGLSWSVRLLEDVLIFYPALKEMHTTVLGIGLAITLIHLISLTLGIRAAYKLSAPRAFLVAAIAAVPLRLGEIWLYWHYS